MTHDLRAGAVIMAVAVLYLLGANMIPQAGNAATVGPRAFPIGIGVLMLLSGVWLALSSWRTQRSGVAPAPLEPVDWRTWGICLGLLLAYALLQPLLGFLICTPPFFLGQAWAFGSRDWKRDALIAVLITVVIWAGFNYGLGIRIS
jgi:putative tricarboxylic transport membrane protein